MNIFYCFLVPLAPKNLQVIEKTSTSITLAWDRPDGTDPILSYEIYINNSRTKTVSITKHTCVTM